VAKVLADTGPLVAWLDKGDGDHARCTAFFAGFQGQLVTTWLVLTEVCLLLPRHIVGCFMRWLLHALGSGGGRGGAGTVTHSG